MRRYFCEECNKENDKVKSTNQGFEYPSNWITLKDGMEELINRLK